MKNLRYLLFAIALFGLLSCETDEEPVPVIAQQSIQVIDEVVSEISRENATHGFEYDYYEENSIWDARNPIYDIRATIDIPELDYSLDTVFSSDKTINIDKYFEYDGSITIYITQTYTSWDYEDFEGNTRPEPIVNSSTRTFNGILPEGYYFEFLFTEQDPSPQQL